jgi:acetylornithine deacetylase/succinyl-diaminopimelate desuccinylase-like protein
MSAGERIDWNGAGDEAVEIFRDLVRFDTSNPPGHEEQAVRYVERLLAREGVPSVVVEAACGRSNLVARLPGAGNGPSLLLDSHVDVVGADPREWKSPPFAAEIRDGCVWGRGTLDMKQMTAQSLAVMLAVARGKIKLAGDLVVAVTADEEQGSGLGARFLAERHPDLVRADFALGEVGGMNLTVGNRRIYPVQVAEKGICWLKLTVTGKGGHGSLPRTDSVPRKIGRLLELLGQTRFPIAPHPAATAFLAAMAEASPPVSRAVISLVAGGTGTAFLLANLVPKDKSDAMRALLSHTCQPTVVECGDQINVVPSSGTVLADCRMLPGTSPEEMKAMIEDRVGGLARVELVRGHRGHAVAAENPLFERIRRTVEQMDPGAVVSPYLMPGFTNGSAYVQLGTKYMGFTPVLMPAGLEFTALVHAADERCPVEGFKWGVRTLFEVVTGFLAR